MANIQVDVYTLRNAIKEAIDYVQGTNVIGIVFHFRDFDIPSGVSAKVYVKKPSGKAVYNTATINGNDINLKVTDQMFSETGITKLQVQITNGSSDLVSFVQPVIVHENNVAGDVPESKNESNFLDEYIQEMESATSAANNATKNANNAAAAANNALESIEEAVQGTIINDNSPSSNTTYSGNKIDDMARVNLFDFNSVTYFNCTGVVSGNKITITSTNVSSSQIANNDFILEKNKYYTLVWKSTRTGKYGGGVVIGYFLDNKYIQIINKVNELNGYITFKTPESFEKIRIMLYSGTAASQISDSATFWDIMLIEGTEYIPAMYNSRDIARFISTVSNKTNINLFDYSGILYSHCTGSVSGNTITAKISDLNATSDVRKVYSNLKKNTNYTVSFKSTRTGRKYGGGIIIAGDISGNIINVGNNINAITTFNTGENNQITLRFILGYSTEGSEVGDSATFTDIMLVEGEFAPGEYVPYIGADTFSDAIAGIKTTSTEMATNILQNASDISELQMNLTDTKKEIETVDEKISDYKLLWSGNYYPTDEQKCNLSEKVSAQKNGIVLWFSFYDPGESSDKTGWWPYYVHKSLLDVKSDAGSPGSGCCVPVISNTTFTVIGTKYIYIFDTYVTGHATNNQSGTKNGITYDNGQFSLRYIYGW